MIDAKRKPYQIHVIDSRNLRTIQIQDALWNVNSKETLKKVNKILNDTDMVTNSEKEGCKFDWDRFKSTAQEMPSSLILREGNDGNSAEYRNPEKRLTPGVMDSTILHCIKYYKRGIHLFEVNINYVSPIQYNSHVHLYIGIGKRQDDEEPSKICRWWLSLTKMMFLQHYTQETRVPMITQYPFDIMDLPNKTLMVLDMDLGTVGFIVNDKYLGHALGGLGGLEIIPNISYYGNVDCDIKMECIGSYDEPRSLLSICGKRLYQLVNKEAFSNGDFEKLSIPASLKNLVKNEMKMI